MGIDTIPELLPHTAQLLLLSATVDRTHTHTHTLLISLFYS